VTARRDARPVCSKGNCGYGCRPDGDHVTQQRAGTLSHTPAQEGNALWAAVAKAQSRHRNQATRCNLAAVSAQ